MNERTTPLASIDAADFNKITEHLSLSALGAFHRLVAHILTTPSLSVSDFGFDIPKAICCSTDEWVEVRDVVLPLLDRGEDGRYRLKDGMFLIEPASNGGL